eukprot:gene9328-14460_t
MPNTDAAQPSEVNDDVLKTPKGEYLTALEIMLRGLASGSSEATSAISAELLASSARKGYPCAKSEGSSEQSPAAFETPVVGADQRSVLTHSRSLGDTLSSDPCSRDLFSASPERQEHNVKPQEEPAKIGRFHVNTNSDTNHQRAQHPGPLNPSSLHGAVCGFDGFSGTEQPPLCTGVDTAENTLCIGVDTAENTRPPEHGKEDLIVANDPSPDAEGGDTACAPPANHDETPALLAERSGYNATSFCIPKPAGESGRKNSDVHTDDESRDASLSKTSQVESGTGPETALAKGSQDVSSLVIAAAQGIRQDVAACDGTAENALPPSSHAEWNLPNGKLSEEPGAAPRNQPCAASGHDASPEAEVAPQTVSCTSGAVGSFNVHLEGNHEAEPHTVLCPLGAGERGGRKSYGNHSEDNHEASPATGARVATENGGATQPTASPVAVSSVVRANVVFIDGPTAGRISSASKFEEPDLLLLAAHTPPADEKKSVASPCSLPKSPLSDISSDNQRKQVQTKDTATTHSEVATAPVSADKCFDEGSEAAMLNHDVPPAIGLYPGADAAPRSVPCSIVAAESSGRTSCGNPPEESPKAFVVTAATGNDAPPATEVSQPKVVSHRSSVVDGVARGVIRKNVVFVDSACRASSTSKIGEPGPLLEPRKSSAAGTKKLAKRSAPVEKRASTLRGTCTKAAIHEDTEDSDIEREARRLLFGDDVDTGHEQRRAAEDNNAAKESVQENKPSDACNSDTEREGRRLTKDALSSTPPPKTKEPRRVLKVGPARRTQQHVTIKPVFKPENRSPFPTPVFETPTRQKTAAKPSSSQRSKQRDPAAKLAKNAATPDGRETFAAACTTPELPKTPAGRHGSAPAAASPVNQALIDRLRKRELAEKEKLRQWEAAERLARKPAKKRARLAEIDPNNLALHREETQPDGVCRTPERLRKALEKERRVVVKDTSPSKFKGSKRVQQIIDLASKDYEYQGLGAFSSAALLDDNDPFWIEH